MLQAIGLTKHYQHHIALDNLNMTVKPGEVFCLLGKNGAGKTTTINLFLGFTEATSGEALVNGLVVKPNEPAAKKFIAYIPEIVMLYGNLTCIENLDFFSRLAGFTYTRKELEYFLSSVELQSAAFDRRLAKCTRGMRQKVGIAIALAKNAAALLMDEPTAGLDPKATDEFSALIKGLAAQGKTILMATHDLFNAAEVGTKVGIMRKGVLIHECATANINVNELQKLYLETI